MVLTLLQIVFVGCALVGVGLWSVPAALIIAGVVGVVACELADRRRPSPPGPREGERR